MTGDVDDPREVVPTVTRTKAFNVFNKRYYIDYFMLIAYNEER